VSTTSSSCSRLTATSRSCSTAPTWRGAIDGDVEAHGLRKQALVLTVAVASAATAASAAAAGGTPDGRHFAVTPDAKRFHGIEITTKRFHGVGPDTKRFHGFRPDGTRGGF